jgi:lipopolysaccharide cholinephosphotransferase
VSGPEVIGEQELRELQLHLLDDFARRCDELDLRWFATAGTLLGAVRHEGYIPWDDDIDVMMMRSDFERFCSTFEDSHLKLASLSTDPDYPFPFAKLYDPGTRVVEHYDPMPRYGVHIDIFPVDGLPRSRFGARVVLLAVRLLRLLLGGRIVLPASRERRSSRSLLRLARLVTRGIDPAGLGRLLTRVAAREPADDTPCGLLVWGDLGVVPLRALRTSVPLRFEHGQVPAPIGWHECLTAFYGDYMVPPSVGRRFGHPKSTAFRMPV